MIHNYEKPTMSTNRPEMETLTTSTTPISLLGVGTGKDNNTFVPDEVETGHHSHKTKLLW